MGSSVLCLLLNELISGVNSYELKFWQNIFSIGFTALNHLRTFSLAKIPNAEIRSTLKFSIIIIKLWGKRLIQMPKQVVKTAKYVIYYTEKKVDLFVFCIFMPQYFVLKRPKRSKQVKNGQIAFYPQSIIIMYGKLCLVNTTK